MEKVTLNDIMNYNYNEALIYNNIPKNEILYLNFTSFDTQQYAVLKFNIDYEVDDKDTNNTYYFLLINNKLNVTCLSNYENDKELPTQDKFNKNSNSSCKIINYNETYKIIRYDKVIESHKNLFVFYLSNPSEFSDENYEVKRLSFPKRLEEKMNNFEEKPNEIKILFFESLGSVINAQSHIFYLSQKRNFFMFYEL